MFRHLMKYQGCPRPAEVQGTPGVEERMTGSGDGKGTADQGEAGASGVGARRGRGTREGRGPGRRRV